MPRKTPYCVGSASFDPDAFFAGWSDEQSPQKGDLEGAIIGDFKLKSNDDYIYHATASVSLDQVQNAINAGGQHGLHAWYLFEDARLKSAPLKADIEAYTAMFSPKTSTSKALIAFASNAKKESIRAAVAKHLQDEFLPPSTDTKLALPAKSKTAHVNPYYDYWAWSCFNLEWAGPTPGTGMTKQSHHILPVLYHHFGCVCPTYDAVCLIQQLAKVGTGTAATYAPVVEIGSGNGYWAYVLRRAGLTVYAVDNELSAWRTMWIGDTIVADGVSFVQKPPAQYKDVGKGASAAVLLLVYPQVSDGFTGKVIGAYEGDTVVVAGTQNVGDGNGFTAFKDETIAAWMARERPEFERICQIPLPSFAGKDEALFVFRRRGKSL